MKSRSSREIRNLGPIAVQGRPRSSILVPIESVYQLLIVTLDYLVPFSRYWRRKLENGQFSTPHLFDAPAHWEAASDLFWMKLIPHGIGLEYDENCKFLCSADFDWSTSVTDSQKDGRTTEYSALCIYAVAR